jgi:hypothetical protein
VIFASDGEDFAEAAAAEAAKYAGDMAAFLHE